MPSGWSTSAGTSIIRSGAVDRIDRRETVAVSAADAQLRTVSPGLVRIGVALVCAACIAGLIVSSIADRTHAALAFGLVGAAAAVGLILVAAVAPPGREAPATFDDALAAQVETSIAGLVADGADEESVRKLVKQSISLGRSSPS